MTQFNILDQMYADLVLDNQWSLAGQLCTAIKQNQADKDIISGFRTLKTAYLLETVAMFRGDPMSADFVKIRENETKLVDAAHVSSIVKAISATMAYETEDKEAVITALRRVAAHYNDKPETSISKWFAEAFELIDFEEVSSLKTQQELEYSNKAIESVIFWTNLFHSNKKDDYL